MFQRYGGDPHELSNDEGCSPTVALSLLRRCTSFLQRLRNDDKPNQTDVFVMLQMIDGSFATTRLTTHTHETL